LKDVAYNAVFGFFERANPLNTVAGIIGIYEAFTTFGDDFAKAVFEPNWEKSGEIAYRAGIKAMGITSVLASVFEAGGTGSSLPPLGPELEEALPSTAERAATSFQDIVGKADRLLRSNPDLIMEFGGSSKGAPISPNQLGAAIGQYAEGNPAFARALGGNAMEAVVNAIIEDQPPGTGSFMQVGGPNRIDFIGTGDFAGYTFELTTEAGVAGHALRAYMQEPGSMIFTYIPIVQ
jgi:hypothetical protein